MHNITIRRSYLRVKRKVDLDDAWKTQFTSNTSIFCLIRISNFNFRLNYSGQPIWNTRVRINMGKFICLPTKYIFMALCVVGWGLVVEEGGKVECFWSLWQANRTICLASIDSRTFEPREDAVDSWAVQFSCTNDYPISRV